MQQYWYRIVALGGLAIFLLTACIAPDAVVESAGLAASIDETGQPIEARASFTRGEMVYLAMEFTGGYEGLEVQATWLQGDRALQTDTLKFEQDASRLNPLWVSAHLQTGLDWPAGEYRCEVFIPDQGTSIYTFTLK